VSFPNQPRLLELTTEHDAEPTGRPEFADLAKAVEVARDMIAVRRGKLGLIEFCRRRRRIGVKPQKANKDE
jgi:hypothetical protein